MTACDDSVCTTWSEQLTPVTIKDLTSHVGPNISITDTPLDVFEFSFSDSTRNAQQVMGEEQYSTIKMISVEELKTFFGFLILKCIDHLYSLVKVQTGYILYLP